jgi:hypothetical protein
MKKIIPSLFAFGCLIALAPVASYAITTGSGSAVISNGAVTSITVTNGGSGMTIAPTISILDSSGGTGATATATLSNGSVSSITVTNGGSGYNSATTQVLILPAAGDLGTTPDDPTDPTPGTTPDTTTKPGDTPDPSSALPAAGTTDVVLGGISTNGYVHSTGRISAGFAIYGGSSGTSPMTVLTTGKGAIKIDTLNNPTMTIAPLGGATVATNTDWKGSIYETELTATGFFNGYQDDDSGIYTTLDPGNWLAETVSSDGDAGSVLTEIFDTWGFWEFGDNNGARMTGISTNGFVLTSEPMTAGISLRNFNVVNPDANASKRIIVMGKFSLHVDSSNWLDDPKLTVKDFNGNILGTNDDWEDNDQATLDAITTTGLMNGFRQDKDACLILNVPNSLGNILIELSTQDPSDDGGALVEVYDLDLLQAIYGWQF